jgi:hypothetical protein
MSGDEMTREEAEALTEQIRLTSMLMVPGAMQIMGQFVAADLAELEAEIETGLATFMRTGLALYAIRDRRLYADTHDTFEAYCLDRWGFTDRRARQLIDAAETGTMVPVKNERQARALAGLSPADAAEVWEQAVAEAAAAGRAVTAAELAAKAEALAAVDPGKAVVPSAPEEPEGEQGEPGFNLPAPDEESPAGPPPAGDSSSSPEEHEEHDATDEVEELDEEQASDHEEVEEREEHVSPQARAKGHLDGLVDARLLFRDSTTKAQGKAEALLKLDPAEIVDHLNVDELDDWKAYAHRLTTWAMRLDHAVSEAATPNLRSVQ